jgi:hypothetical protein
MPALYHEEFKVADLPLVTVSFRDMYGVDQLYKVRATQLTRETVEVGIRLQLDGVVFSETPPDGATLVVKQLPNVPLRPVTPKNVMVTVDGAQDDMVITDD